MKFEDVTKYSNTDKTANVGDLVCIEYGYEPGRRDKYIGMTAIVFSTAQDDSRCYSGSEHKLQLLLEDGRTFAWWEACQLRLIKTDQYPLAMEWLVKSGQASKMLADKHMVSTDCWIIRNKADGRVWGRVGGVDSGHDEDVYGWTYDVSEIITLPYKPEELIKALDSETPDYHVLNEQIFGGLSRERADDIFANALVVKVKFKRKIEVVV